MSWPEPEVVINEPLVRALLESQFPDCATDRVTQLGSGFDNSIWRVGNEHVVRLPRRRVALNLLENEIRWVAQATRLVSVATPAPYLEGRPEFHYPWPWALVKWIDGTPGDELDLDANGHSAPALAGFLRELHTAAPTGAPMNTSRSATLADRAALFHERLDSVRAIVDGDEAQRVFDLGRNAGAWAKPRTWIHGDFHPANTLYVDGELNGVVDFGDLCAGDPATDLAGGLMALPLRALEDFFTSYGEVDDDTIRRTLGWAVSLGAFFASLGLAGRPTYLEVGSRALRNAVELSRGL